MKAKFYLQFTLALVSVLALVCLSSRDAFGQKRGTTNVSSFTTNQRDPYNTYRGVQLGMSDQEVRAKLGQPTSLLGELDYYVLSEKETAQIVYSKERKVVTISVDYIDGLGAPDNKLVVGGELEQRPNGSLYKMVRHTDLGFWVSYNRTNGSVVIVTVTIQKIL
jgi:hypothetical protein